VATSSDFSLDGYGKGYFEQAIMVECGESITSGLVPTLRSRRRSHPHGFVLPDAHIRA
jgi:hypothetical protein